MTTDQSLGESDHFDAFCQSLRMNINAALSVAGPERDDGRAGGFRDTDVHRQTGIARSTLRAVKQGATNQASTPDLRTLTKLAGLLGVPVAFLLMTPKDWELLVKALGDLELTLRSADEVLGNDFGNHATVRRVLERMGMFRSPRPSNVTPDPREKDRLDKADERRRRLSHTLGALMLRQPEYRALHAQHVALVALAASIAIQIKQPTDKDRAHDTQH